MPSRLPWNNVSLGPASEYSLFSAVAANGTRYCITTVSSTCVLLGAAGNWRLWEGGRGKEEKRERGRKSKRSTKGEQDGETMKEERERENLIIQTLRSLRGDQSIILRPTKWPEKNGKSRRFSPLPPPPSADLPWRTKEPAWTFHDDQINEKLYLFCYTLLFIYISYVTEDIHFHLFMLQEKILNILEMVMIW